MWCIRTVCKPNPMTDTVLKKEGQPINDENYPNALQIGDKWTQNVCLPSKTKENTY